MALAFDLLVSGDDIRRKPLFERKAALKWVLRRSREGIQYVDHAEGDGEEMFAAVCKLGPGRNGVVSGSRRFIDPGPQKPGSKSKTQSRPRQLARRTARTCPFSGAKRTYPAQCRMSAYGPKRTLLPLYRSSVRFDFGPCKLLLNQNGRALRAISAGSAHVVPFGPIRSLARFRPTGEDCGPQCPNQTPPRGPVRQIRHFVL